MRVNQRLDLLTACRAGAARCNSRPNSLDITPYRISGNNPVGSDPLGISLFYKKTDNIARQYYLFSGDL